MRNRFEGETFLVRIVRKKEPISFLNEKKKSKKLTLAPWCYHYIYMRTTISPKQIEILFLPNHGLWLENEAIEDAA